MAAFSFKGSNKGSFGADTFGTRTTTFNAAPVAMSNTLVELFNNPAVQLLSAAALLIVTLKIVKGN